MRDAGQRRGSVVGGGAGAHLDDPNGAAISVLLDSRFDGDKLDALKNLLALVSRAGDVAHLSPQVRLASPPPLVSSRSVSSHAVDSGDGIASVLVAQAAANLAA